MFEKFSPSARRAVVAAVRHAGQLGHGSVGPEHILLGVLAGADPDLPGCDRVTTRVLARIPLTYAEAVRRVRAGVSEAVRRGGLDETDVAALADLGIDVAAVVERAEETFGPGALVPCRSGQPRRHRLRLPGRLPGRRRLPGQRRAHRATLRPETRTLLSGALIQARDLGHRVLGTEHLLLAILASGRGQAYDLLREAGLDYLTTRQAVMTELRRAS